MPKSALTHKTYKHTQTPAPPTAPNMQPNTTKRTVLRIKNKHAAHQTASLLQTTPTKRTQHANIHIQRNKREHLLVCGPNTTVRQTCKAPTPPTTQNVPTIAKHPSMQTCANKRAATNTPTHQTWCTPICAATTCQPSHQTCKPSHQPHQGCELAT